MGRPLIVRLERLEAILTPKLVPLIRYGWLLPLPADYVGERHIVIVKQEPTRSPHFECFIGGDLPAVLDDSLPDILRKQDSAHDLAAVVYGAEHAAAGQSRRGAPCIDLHLYPGRHGNGAQAAAFTQQVDDCPAAIALLDVLEGDLGGLGAAQSAADL